MRCDLNGSPAENGDSQQNQCMQSLCFPLSSDHVQAPSWRDASQRETPSFRGNVGNESHRDDNSNDKCVWRQAGGTVITDGGGWEANISATVAEAVATLTSTAAAAAPSLANAKEAPANSLTTAEPPASLSSPLTPHNRQKSGLLPTQCKRGLDGSDKLTPRHRRLPNEPVQLKASQFYIIFRYQRAMSRWTSRVNAAICPAAREGLEWMKSGFALDSQSQIVLRRREDEGGHAVERHVQVFTPRIPRQLTMARWWLQRQPRLPILLRAPALHTRLALDEETFGGLANLDVSGSTTLMDIEVTASLSELYAADFNGCSQLLFLPSFATAVNLRRIVLSGSAVMDLGGLASCVYLEDIDVSWCEHLTSLYGLSSLQHLRNVRAPHSALVDITGVAGCVMLEVLNLAECTGVVDITALAECPALRKLDLTGTSITDMSALCRLKDLEELLVVDCKSLLEYRAIRNLLSLSAQFSGLATILCEHTQGALEFASFNDCRQLTTLSSFAGAPNLKKLTATFTAVGDASGLGSCEVLTELDLSYCIFLRNVDGLAGAPSLATVTLAFSAVESIEGLRRCRALETVSLSSCKKLTDVSPLNGLPALRKVTLKASAATSVVRDCRTLVSLDVAGCKGIVDLSPLAEESPDLERLVASGSGVSDVSFLPRMKSLMAAQFDDCPIADVSFLLSLQKSKTGR